MEWHYTSHSSHIADITMQMFLFINVFAFFVNFLEAEKSVTIISCIL